MPSQLRNLDGIVVFICLGVAQHSIWYSTLMSGLKYPHISVRFFDFFSFMQNPFFILKLDDENDLQNWQQSSAYISFWLSIGQYEVYAVVLLPVLVKP